VRLHRARLFVRKELAKQVQPRMRRKMAESSRGRHLSAQPRQRRCKEMFAELSNYLDDELDDSPCEELEKHMDGCAPCKAFLSSLEKSIQQCRTAPNESPDPRVAPRLRRELLSEYQGLMGDITKRDAMRSYPSSRLSEFKPNFPVTNSAALHLFVWLRITGAHERHK